MIWKSALRRYLLASVVLAAGGSLFATFNGVPLEPEADEGPTVGATSLEDLRETYARWAEGYAEAEPAGPVISLVWNRGLSRHHSDAKGLAQLDLARGTVSVRIKGLDPATAADVWLVDNRPGSWLPRRRASWQPWRAPVWPSCANARPVPRCAWPWPGA